MSIAAGSANSSSLAPRALSTCARRISVCLSLQTIADKCTFLVFPRGVGVRRCDTFLSELTTARNILTDRRNRLIDCGTFKKRT
jgi:hypothetical protein